jgi:hypothetical protein
LWVLLVLVLSLGASLNAQVAGRLSGSVVDQTGGAIPGAKVTVFVPGGKEPVLSGTTNESGLFSFMAVRPASYDVFIEATGFAKAVVRNVKVDPLQETSLSAVKLELQSTAVTVDVSADVQSVQLNNAEVSSTITSTQVQNLPVLGRQVSSLILTQSGVGSGTDTTAVNGLKSSFSNVTLDGINIQDNFIRTNALDYAPMRTTIDQIAEITVSTSNEGAGIGGGASQVILSTKSGSNSYHGSVYWYNRNSALGANNWFNNKSGVALPRLDLNQPGASLGGRIIKDKLFFFTNYELYRNKRQTGVLNTVLTDSARNGIFTYKDSAGNTRQTSLASLRNFVADPAIKAMLAQLPEPNTSDAGDGLNTLGYRFNSRYNESRDQLVFRGDYYLNAKHSFTGTYNYINDPTDRPDYGTFYTTIPPVSNKITNHLMSLAWRWTASPTLTNEARFGFSRDSGLFVVSNKYPSSIVGGLLFTNPIDTYMNQGRNPVNTHAQDNATWLKGKHEISFGFQAMLMTVSPYNDAGILPTYTLGISTANPNGFSTADLPGANSAALTAAGNLYANLAGVISSAAQTFNVTSATSGFVPGATNVRDFSWNTFAPYVQDKWKIRPNLTINLGLRYEYWTPLNEKNGLYLAPVLENNNALQTLLDPNATLNFIGGRSGRPFYHTDKKDFAPNIGFAWDPFKDGGKTSIRGGYMIAYVNDNLIATIRNSVGTSAGLSSAITMSNLTSLLSNAPTVATPAYKVPRTLADNYAATTTSATAMPDPNLTTPYVHQWTLGIQREYKGAIFSARYVGNRGSSLLRGIDVNQINYNANGFLADFQRAQNNGVLAQNATGVYNPAYNANIPGSQPLPVFGQLSNANLSNSTIQTYIKQGQIGTLADTYMTNGWNGSVPFYSNPKVQGANLINNSGMSIYHALQLEASKRTRSGLQVQFSYTFSKDLSNAGGDAQTNFEPLLDNKNPGLEYVRAPYDMKHSFKANYYYELPYGKGKKWSGNRVTNAVLGNWAISGIWGYNSGSPYSILSGYGTLNRAARSTSTNTASVYGIDWDQLNKLTNSVYMTGNGPYFISPSIINVLTGTNPGGDGRGAAPAGSAAFNGQAFYNPTAGTVGNLSRRMFSGPWQWSWDASVVKSVVLTDRQHIDLHLDVFNWANHPTFYVAPNGGDYGSTTNFTINNTTFGKLTSMNYGPRVIQIGAYYRF